MIPNLELGNYTISSATSYLALSKLKKSIVDYIELPEEHLDVLVLVMICGVSVYIIPEAINRYYLGDDYKAIDTSTYDVVVDIGMWTRPRMAKDNYPIYTYMG
ncbi:hypothetical protein HAX54_033533, partial [Datura stramonium]|nr:hypothetical protein [Datura stramonium]